MKRLENIPMFMMKKRELERRRMSKDVMRSD